MPIEIKELHIKVRIENEKSTFAPTNTVSAIELASLKSQIVKECTKRILEKLKETEER